MGGPPALRRWARTRDRSADDEHEVPLAAYGHFAERDPLSAVVLERMLAGVSTRRYARTGEPVGAEVDELGRSTSKSAVSREFISRGGGSFAWHGGRLFQESSRRPPGPSRPARRPPLVASRRAPYRARSQGDPPGELPEPDRPGEATQGVSLRMPAAERCLVRVG
jgi:hypothetical protein